MGPPATAIAWLKVEPYLIDFRPGSLTLPVTYTPIDDGLRLVLEASIICLAILFLLFLKIITSQKE